MIESTTDKLKLSIEGTTAIVSVDNPSANVWDAESLVGLRDLVCALNAEREIYALVITGAGEKFFSAGADLKVFADGDKANARLMARRFGEAFETLAAYRGVSIAAINGYAMGGGLECAMACDIRIAEAHAQMALPEGTVGLLPCGGGTQNLSWIVGEGWAKRMILCGERVDAATAERIGLVEQVVLAEKVANQSPTSVAACKGLIQKARSGPINGAYTSEREAFVDLFDTQDQAEGVNAFLEKRKAAWKNA